MWSDDEDNEGPIEELEDFFGNMNMSKQPAPKSEVPEALAILKRRFLCALGKGEPSATEQEDEEILQRCLAKFNLVDKNQKTIWRWCDNIGHDNVNEILEKYAKFDIRIYVDCVKVFYLAYSGRKVSNVSEAITYTLTHARSFGDPQQNIFHLKPNRQSRLSFIDAKEITEPLSSDTKYMRKISSLIEGLKIDYNETQYRTLNANVTYLILLLLTRFVRTDAQFLQAFAARCKTHADYVKLCPLHIDTQLPSINARFNETISKNELRDSVFLAIHGVVTGDAATKRVLWTTCVLRMEWNGLQFPSLFFRMAKLFEMDESKTWDALASEETFPSLWRLADDYYTHYTNVRADSAKTAFWFPFCRALSGKYHKNLTAAENKEICLRIALVIDRKIGLKKSFIRKSHWAQDWPQDKALKFAKEFVSHH